MTSRELEILYSVYRRGGGSPLRTISKELGLSSEYVFLISKGLLNQKLIKKTANNVFILTANGRSLLEQKDSQGSKKKTPILIEVSRSFDKGVEPPSFEPEIRFIKREFMPEQSYVTEHNLDKEQVTEVVDAKLIQKTIEQLIFTKGRELQNS